MKIAFLLDSFQGGGAEKVSLVLAEEFVRRAYDVTVVSNKMAGSLTGDLTDHLHVVTPPKTSVFVGRLLVLRIFPTSFVQALKPVLLAKRPPKAVCYIGGLAKWLKKESPDVLIAGTPFLNLEAIWSTKLANSATKVIIVEHTYLSEYLLSCRGWRWNRLAPLLARIYPNAHGAVAVSNGVAEDMSRLTGVKRNSITTIYNPVVTQDHEQRILEHVDHPWFQNGEPPVIISVGRLSDEKDYATLLRAFSIVRAARAARLVVLGEAPDKKQTVERIKSLSSLAGELGIREDVDFPGFVPNPLKYMKKAAVFALTSRFEGLGNVLIEALACGCPVVSTDCPSGPAEILDNGKYGKLVPVGDVDAIAKAILATLENPGDKQLLRKRGAAFTCMRAADQYEDLIKKVVSNQC